MSTNTTKFADFNAYRREHYRKHPDALLHSRERSAMVLLQRLGYIITEPPAEKREALFADELRAIAARKATREAGEAQ